MLFFSFGWWKNVAGDNDDEGEGFCHCLWFYVLQILFGGGLLVCEQLLTKAKPTRSWPYNVATATNKFILFFIFIILICCSVRSRQKGWKHSFSSLQEDKSCACQHEIWSIIMNIFSNSVSNFSVSVKKSWKTSLWFIWSVSKGTTFKKRMVVTFTVY